jgi:peptidoglycan/LPS O-acetylase OafA/YrhL
MTRLVDREHSLRDHIEGERGIGQRSHTYIAGIDGLRAVAVLGVLLYHLHPALLPGGFAGVDFFFVISGFVVALATAAIPVSTQGGLLLAFYRRRIVRILPASLALILVTMIAATLFVPITGPFTPTDMTALAATVGMANVILWYTAGDYFAPGTELNLFTHTWSLGVEEQFYFVFPFLAFLFLKSRNKTWRLAGLASLLALSAMSLAIAAVATSRAPTFAFYMIPSRFWELGAGVSLYLAIRHQHRPPPRTLVVALATAIGVVALVFSFAFSGRLGFPFPGAAVMVGAAVALIYVLTRAPKSSAARFFAIPPLRYVGRISYSLYLWHWVVIAFFRWTIGIETASEQIAALLLSWAMADLSYRLIERPTRGNGWLASRGNLEVIGIGIGAMAATGLIVVGMVGFRPVISRSVTREAAIWTPSYLPIGQCPAVRTKANMVNGGIRYDFRRTTCPVDRRTRLFVVGDSHAWAYQRLFGTVAQRTGTPITVMMAPGCPVLPGYTPRNPGAVAHCEAFLKTAFSTLPSDLKRGDVIFLPGLRTPRYREYTEMMMAAPEPMIRYSPAMIAKQARALSKILDRGARVVIEAPKPVYRFGPIRCSDWFNADNPHCAVDLMTRREALERRAPVMAALAQLKQADPRIEIWDPFPFLCSGEICDARRNGKPISFDGDHLSGYGNDLLMPPFLTMLR